MKTHRTWRVILTLPFMAISTVGAATGPTVTARLGPVALDRTVETTVTALGVEPHDFVVDSGRGLVYVSSQVGNEIVSVDLASGSIVARRPFADPTGLDLSWDGHYLYVALGASMGIARVDLNDWSVTEVTLPELGHYFTWDVIEVAPRLVLVSANGEFGAEEAYIVRYDFNTATADRVAGQGLFLAGPRLAIDDGDFAYIGEGYVPNSLYKLDLGTPLFDIVEEDNHGDLSGTQILAVSPDSSYLVLSSGQKVSADTLLPTGSFPAGPPAFSDNGTLVYTLDDPGYGWAVQVSDASSEEHLETWTIDCSASSQFWLENGKGAFAKAEGLPLLIATTPTGLCLIHTDTAAGPPPLPPGSIPPGGRFFDDDGNIFEPSIEAIAFEGITRGCNPPYQTGFCPGDRVTRGQMAAFLVRAFGYTDNGGGDLFTDNDESVFEGDIDRLAAAGVTKGCNPPDNTRFCPGDPVTRGQMAAFLVRAFGYTDNGGGDLFTDDDESVFEGDIDRLAAAGVTKGCNPPDNTRFCPRDPVTRGQMAAFLARAFELPQPAVPARGDTLDGFDLDVIGTADAQACNRDPGVTCEINQTVNGEFYLFTGWYTDDWSSASSAERATFQSDRVRVEASFDGVPIDLVKWPLEVIDDVAYKSYSFQFPGWLQGEHLLVVEFVDEPGGYVTIIRDLITAQGPGYPLPARVVVAAGAADVAATPTTANHGRRSR